MTPQEELAAIQAHFHVLIGQRAVEFGAMLPSDLPVVTEANRRKGHWFAVPGMYGGFAFRLSGGAGQRRLSCESWSRISEGSEQKHLIDAQGITLIDSGWLGDPFVFAPQPG